MDITFTPEEMQAAAVANDPLSFTADEVAHGRQEFQLDREIRKYRKGEQGVAIGWGEYIGERLPFIGFSRLDSGAKYDRYQQGEATDADISEIARQMHKQEIEESKHLDKGAGWQGFGRQVFDAATRLPAFGVEMYASGPSAEAASVGARTLAARALGKSTAGALMKTTAGRLALQYGIGGGANLAVRTAMSPNIIAQGVNQRMQPSIAWTRDDKSIIQMEIDKKGASFYEAFGPALLDASIEIFSEMSGEKIGDAAGWIWRQIPGQAESQAKATLFSLWQKKNPGKTIQDFVKAGSSRAGYERLFADLLEDRLQKGLSKAGESGWSMAGDAMRKAGIHGIGSEWAEERLGDALRYAAGTQDRLIPTWEDLAVEGATLAIPGAIQGGAHFMEGLEQRQAANEYQALMADREAITTQLSDEETMRVLTPEFARKFAIDNPKAAKIIASADTPSMAAFQEANLGAWIENPGHRQQFAQLVREALLESDPNFKSSRNKRFRWSGSNEQSGTTGSGSTADTTDYTPRPGSTAETTDIAPTASQETPANTPPADGNDHLAGLDFTPPADLGSPADYATPAQWQKASGSWRQPFYDRQKKLQAEIKRLRDAGEGVPTDLLLAEQKLLRVTSLAAAEKEWNAAKAQPAPTGVVEPTAPARPSTTERASVPGRETSIEVAGGKPIQGRYAVMELDDLQASNSYRKGMSAPNPNYPAGLQPRSYARGGDDDLKVKRFAEEQKADYYLTDQPDATSGPPVVTGDGVVLNGNGRVMSLQLSAANGTLGKWYTPALAGRMQQFGLDPAAAQGMKNPVLVRMVDMAADSPAAMEFARAGNVSATQAQSPMRTAAAYAHLIDSDLIDAIPVEEDETLSSMLNNSKAGREWIKRLRNEFPASQTAHFFTEDGLLTDAGKELVQNMMLLQVFPVAILDRMGAEHKAWLADFEGAIPQLISLRRDSKTNIIGQLNEALDFLLQHPDVKTPGHLRDALGQGKMFDEGPPALSPAAQMLAEWRIEIGRGKDGRQSRAGKKVRESLAAMKAALRATNGGLFGESLPVEDAVGDALGVKPIPGAEFGEMRKPAAQPAESGPVEAFGPTQRQMNLPGETGPRGAQGGIARPSQGGGIQQRRMPLTGDEPAGTPQGPAGGQLFPPQPGIGPIGPNAPQKPRRAKPTPPPIETSDAGPSDAPRRLDIIERMAADFDVPIRNGKVWLPGILAAFHKYWNIVRMLGKFYGDLGLASHEIAHKIDDALGLRGKWSFAVESELKGLDYDPSKMRSFEGWAEFLRLYLTGDRAVLAQLAPQTLAWVEGQFKTDHADTFAKLTNLKKLIDAWRQADPEARIRGQRRSDGSIPAPAGISWIDWLAHTLWNSGNDGKPVGWMHWIYTRLMDDGHILGLFTERQKSLGKKYEPGASPIELWRALNGAEASMAQTSLKEGVFSFLVDPETGTRKQLTPGIADAMARIDHNEREQFTSWLHARHALGWWEKGYNPGISREDAQRMYDRGAGNADWVAAGDAITRFLNAQKIMVAELGGVAMEEVEAMIAAHENYIPLSRVRADSVKNSRFGGRALVNLGKVAHGVQGGSGLEIVDPLHSVLETTTRMYAWAIKQRITNAIVENPAAHSGSWVEEIAPDRMRTIFSVAAIWPKLADILEEAGVDPQPIKHALDQMQPGKQQSFLHSLLSVYQPKMNYDGDKPIVKIMVNGQAKFFYVQPDLYHTMSGLESFSLGIPALDWLFGKGGDLLRLGATGLNLGFAIANPIKDFITFLAQSAKSGAVHAFKALPLPDFVSGSTYLGQSISHKYGWEDPRHTLMQETNVELRQGLGRDPAFHEATIFGLFKRSLDSDLRWEAEQWQQNPAGSLWRWMGQPWEWIKGLGERVQDFTAATEIGPRMAEFEAAGEELGWDYERLKETLDRNERPPIEVMAAMANAANDVTVNFKRGGQWLRWLNRGFPYLNAHMQGMEKFLRSWRENPQRAAVAAAAIAAFTYAMWRSYHDDDWYVDAPAWQKYGYWTITDGKGTPIHRIPRPHEWGWYISALTESMLNAAKEGSPKELYAWLGETASKELPDSALDFAPQAAKPGLEAFANWDDFRHRPINSPFDKRSPAEQYNARTTELAKWIGSRFGISPNSVEHMLEGHTGGLYRSITKPAENLLYRGEFTAADFPIFSRFAWEKNYSQSVADFYRLHRTLESQHADARHREQKDGTPIPDEVADRWYMAEQAKSFITDLNQHIGTLTDRDERWRLEKYTVGLARRMMGMSELASRPDPLEADPASLPKEVRELVAKYLGVAEKQLKRKPPKYLRGETAEHFQERLKAFQAAKRRGAAGAMAEIGE